MMIEGHRLAGSPRLSDHQYRDCTTCIESEGRVSGHGNPEIVKHIDVIVEHNRLLHVITQSHRFASRLCCDGSGF